MLLFQKECQYVSAVFHCDYTDLFIILFTISLEEFNLSKLQSSFLEYKGLIVLDTTDKLQLLDT